MTLTKFQALKVIFIMRRHIRHYGWCEKSQEIIDVCKNRIMGRA